MIWIEKGIYVKIIELENGPRPLPLSSGFSATKSYRILGCFNASESSDAFLILANDRQEMWFICNRHLRIVSIEPEAIAFSMPLER